MELVWNERKACKFMATVDGVLISICKTYAFSRAEIVSQLADIYVDGAEIRVFCVEWDIA